MKTAIKAFCAVFLATALVCLAYVHFRSDHLAAKVLHALQKQLTTDLCVEHFRIDGLTAFPRIRFQMQGVSLTGKGGGELLQAGELELSLSIVSAFSGDIRFRKLTLRNGGMVIERLKDGSLSLEVIKSDGSDETYGPEIHFNKILLENFYVRYKDNGSNQEYLLSFHDGELTGSYGYQSLKCKIDGNVTYDYVRLGRSRYLNGVKGTLHGKITAAFDQALYTFGNLKVQLGSLEYTVDGTIRSDEDYEHIDLVIDQTSGDIGTFLSILPVEYRKTLPFSMPKGQFSAKGFVRGRMHETESPHVYFDISVKHADILSPDGNGAVHDVSLDGSFENGSMRGFSTTLLDLPVIRGNAYGEKFNAALHISDFNDPLLKCSFDGALPLSFVMSYTDMQQMLTGVDGTLHFSDLEIQPLRLTQFDFTDLKLFRGKCRMADLKLRTAQAVYQIPEGNITFLRDTMTISDLTVMAGKDRVKGKGWMTHLGDALEGNDPAYLHYALEIDGENLNPSSWIPALAAYEGERKPRVRPATLHTAAPLRLPQGQLFFTAKTFQYDQFKAGQLKCDLQTSLHQVDFTIQGDATDGKLHAHGELETSEGYDLTLALKGESINLHNCFAQCHNFSQQVLRAEHLKGKGDFLLIADVPWTLDGRLMEDRIQVSAGMSVKDGELVGFEMLDQFSKYIHAEDLKHIRFARLDNFIEIRDGNIYIPVMFIQSNAANLMVNGIHRLDNRILYNLKLNVGQVLSSKIKKHNPALTPLPARKDATFNMFFTIAGTVDEFSYDTKKRPVESSFDQSAELRDRIRARLIEAFGESPDFIEPPEWETIPEYDLEQGGEEIFIDFED